jgi:ankyrin
MFTLPQPSSQVKALEMDARERSFLEEVQRHVDSGSSLDALVRVHYDRDGVRIEERAGPRGETRLHRAAWEGWCSAIKSLLEQGANVHAGRPEDGRTPLHDAATCDRRDAAVLLLDAGARVDDRDRCGRTALHSAALQGRTNMCKLLLSRGASLDVRDVFGQDPEASGGLRDHTATVDLLAAVRAAGGWRPYCDAPFLDLRRELLAPGAVAESTVRLYACVFVELPNAVFPRILAFRPDF